MSDEFKKQESGIVSRTMAYSVRIIKLCRELEKDSVGASWGSNFFVPVLLSEQTCTKRKVPRAGTISSPKYISRTKRPVNAPIGSTYWKRRESFLLAESATFAMKLDS